MEADLQGSDGSDGFMSGTAFAKVSLYLRCCPISIIAYDLKQRQQTIISVAKTLIASRFDCPILPSGT